MKAYMEDSQTPHEPQVQTVHVARAIEPERPVVSIEAQRRHERSLHMFPGLNLSEGEYVVRTVRRHPIGLITPLVLGTLLIAAVLTLLLSYDEFATSAALSGAMASVDTIILPGLLFIAVVIAGMSVTSYVYLRNRFILTNESIIQETQQSLFSRREQTVSLANVEDASFTQKGILQYMFNYGDIRLSTEGDETTYRFSYVANPKEHVAELNNAVEAFKYGRPVDQTP